MTSKLTVKLYFVLVSHKITLIWGDFMNFINCSNVNSPELLKKTLIFWCENSIGHIASLLKLTGGTTAVLQAEFKDRLRVFYDEFVKISKILKENELTNSVYNSFLKLNQAFVCLLERMKFEGFAGYPVLQQTVFHYIYEGRYVNAVLGVKNLPENLLITVNFAPFYNRNINCFYNQMYFWSIIGAMHPSLLMGNNAFYSAINGYSKEFLTEVTNGFNQINFKLSSLKRPVKIKALSEVFCEFSQKNLEFLEFLRLIKQGSVKVFSSTMAVRLPSSFYAGVDHQIAEHTLVCEINQNIESVLK